MQEITLVVEILFLEIAKESFNFPISNSVRLSFWFPDGKASTFSEIQIQGERIEIGKPQVIRINLIKRDFLIDSMKVGNEFRMGTFPIAIANGKILEIKEK